MPRPRLLDGTDYRS